MDKNDEEKYRCKICGCKFYTAYLRHKHIFKEHPEIAKPDIDYKR